MDKIYLVIYEAGDEDFQETTITPCATPEAAKRVFDEAVEKDIEEHPDTVQDHTENNYENYEEGFYDDGHTVIRIEERDIVR